VKGSSERKGVYVSIPTSVSGILSTPDNNSIAYTNYIAGHDAAIVIAHGFFCSKDAVLFKSLNDAIIDKYDTLLFDFRGHGSSSGLFTWTSKEAQDLECVLKHVSKKYSKIGLIGFSLGAATSINTLARTNYVKSLIAISAPSDFNKIEFKLWKVDIENDLVYNYFGDGKIGKGVRPGPFWLEKEKPVNSIKSVRIPVQYIHGTSDWTISHKHSQILFDNTISKKRLVIIKNGPHAEFLIRKKYDDTIFAIRSWFRETL